MSKPAMPASVSAPLPTRRQLDELEALLQRMLELPVRQEQEASLLPSAPQRISDRPHESLDDTPTEWDEPPSEAAATIDPEPDQLPETVDSDWNTRADSAPFFAESPHVADPGWDNPNAYVAGRSSPAGDDVIFAAPEPDQVLETPAGALLAETLHPEPGIIRILLGWAGLVCLVVSLAILLLEWYGWTW